ncbi:uncharacterized protein LOC125044058 [Penaeus chinensis]|uniref:uncharacterized protein LOC125044058 n=1 Tax=Penaeus chinensis TaxID=139456 RepID=UPI001FB811F4|nr:uncharacterized protein LOC125044058 [Penaeus chinensis]
MASDAEWAPLENEVRKRNVSACKCHPKPRLFDPWRASFATFLLTCCQDYSTWAIVSEAPAFCLGDLAAGKRRKMTAYEIRLMRVIAFISPCAFVIFKGCFRCLAVMGSKIMEFPEYQLFFMGQKIAKGITLEGISSRRLSLLPIRSIVPSMNQYGQFSGCKLTAVCYPLLMVNQKDTFCVCYLGPSRRLRSKRAFHHRGFHLRKVAKEFEDSPRANFPRLLLKVYSSEISSYRFARFISRAVDQARKISQGTNFGKHHPALERSCLRNIAKSSEGKTEIGSVLQDPPSVFLGPRVRKRSRYLRRLRERQMRREVSSAASELECDAKVPLDRRLDGSDVRNSKCDVTCRVRVCSHLTRLESERVPSSRSDNMPITTRDSTVDISDSFPRVNPRPGEERAHVSENRSPSKPVTKHIGKTPLRPSLCRRPWTVSGVSVVSRAWAGVLIMLTLWACVVTANEDNPMRNGCEAYAGTEGEGRGSHNTPGPVAVWCLSVHGTSASPPSSCKKRMKYTKSRRAVGMGRLSNPHRSASNIGLEFMDYPGIKEISDLVNEMASCKNKPNVFCYTCFEYTIVPNGNPVTGFIERAYHAYFGIKLGDQDRAWAPHMDAANTYLWFSTRDEHNTAALKAGPGLTVSRGRYLLRSPSWRDPRHANCCVLI